MTEEYFNLDFEDNYYESCQQPFTSSRDSGMSSDDTHNKNVQIKKKNISKKYEPIYENNILYRYEDNPEQYKKIRKQAYTLHRKLQNRESANRVRGRQKNYVQDIQQELIDLKQENQQLQMINAKLQAENVVLKQQVEFMQNLMLQKQSVDPPLQMEREKSKNKHLATLTAFTLILGLIVMNVQPPEAKEAIVAATEVPHQIEKTSLSLTSITPYFLGSTITSWLIYAIYVGYKVFLKRQFKKRKLI